MNKRKTEVKNWFESHPLKTLIFTIVAVSFGLDFFVANVFKLTMGYPWPDGMRIKAEGVEKTYRIASKFYHHDLAKNQSVNAVHGNIAYNVYTNSLGFKDKCVRVVPILSDKYRIIFIGDSFTDGIGINYENTFVGLIDSELSKKNIEVFNASVASYSPIIYWRKIKYLIEDVGLKFDELIVFLDISDIEDEVYRYYLDGNGNVAAYPGGSDVDKDYVVHVGIRRVLDEIKDWIRDNSILMYAVLNYSYDTLLPEETSYLLGIRKSIWTIDRQAYHDYGRKGLEKCKLYMDRLCILLKKHNIKLTVAVYPWEDQIFSGDFNSIQVLFWDNWCRQNDAYFVNCFPYFMIGKYKDNTKKYKDNTKRMIDKYFIKGDGHFNEEGHRLIADIFLSFYRGRNEKDRNH